MRFIKWSLMVFCFIVCLASPSYPFDPYKTNIGGFGPRIAGARLGVKMSLRDIVRWRANLRGLPFMLEVNSENISGRKPSDIGSISILMKGNDRNITGFEVVSATRKLYPLRNERMKLPDLLAEIEKAGVETVTLRGSNRRVREDCIAFTEDLRVASVRIRRSDFGAGNMDHEAFVREFAKDYSLPEMRRRGITWGYRNEREGWLVMYHGFGDGIFELAPIITD